MTSSWVYSWAPDTLVHSVARWSASMLLTHWGRDEIDAILQTTVSNAFSLMKMYQFRLKFHWSLFPGVQLTIFQYWFRLWLGVDQATSHYLNQWWLVYWCINASLHHNDLTVQNEKGPCFVFFMRKIFIYMCHLMLGSDRKLSYIVVFPEINSACQRSTLNMFSSVCAHFACEGSLPMGIVVVPKVLCLASCVM